ncbi:hypothetical protein [Amaricoccus solimangrovi]|uniref:Uncharacterized protein n=1 Tax=Amaricoccus solimangrovi TaxID=2589815 RepID=A0A501WEN4_9RHOB|nr:hypothetical protein [Amaricoccus solimangrovi]TPE47878.1 hypothetical protein FJM51_19265 [Amaricoccus solimangrovi]
MTVVHPSLARARDAVFRARLLGEADTLHARLFPEARLFTIVAAAGDGFALALGGIGDPEPWDRWIYPSLRAALLTWLAWNPGDGREPAGWDEHPRTRRRAR